MTVPFEVEIVQEVSIAPSSPSPFSSELFAQAVPAPHTCRAGASGAARIPFGSSPLQQSAKKTPSQKMAFFVIGSDCRAPQLRCSSSWASKLAVVASASLARQDVPKNLQTKTTGATVVFA